MNKLSLILFTTSTCVHCKPMKQYLQEFQQEYGDRLITKVLIVDKSPSDMSIARDWQVSGVPTLLIIANGEEIGQVVGSQTKERLGELIEGCLQSDIFSESSGEQESSSDSVLCDTSEQTDSQSRSN